MEQNEVAILLATYQGEKYIGEQLESLQKQSFQNFKCYIHDDGSVDRTLSIIQNYAQKDPRHFVVLDYPKCGGAKANFMSLLKKVTAPYIMFCDQDDYWYENKIEVLLNKMKEEESCFKGPIAVISEMEIVDSNLKILCDSFEKYSGRSSEKDDIHNLLMQNIIPGCTMMINRKLALLSAQCTNLSNIHMHDWWILVVAATYGKIIKVKKPLMQYRQHNTNEIGAPNKRKLSSHIDTFIREFVRGDLVLKKKRWIENPRKMAQELIKLPDFPIDKYPDIAEFAYIGKKNKIERMRFYITYNYRTDKPQWWLLLWV